MTEKNKRKESFKAQFWGCVILFVVVSALIVDTTKADGGNFYADILRLESVAEKVHQNYVEEVKSQELIENAIKGMLDVLDPHTTFFKKKEYEELRIHTEGKFGGLGIQISIREKILTVMTPIAGTPASRAGIQSGDQIIKIDGKSTEGITIDNAVGKLRGEPGSDVALTIRRKGEIKPLEIKITREIITIKAIPYYGILKDTIGYISLVNFSQEAGVEVEKAIKKLLELKVKGFVFDLRQNPGGLLPEAINVAEKFLEAKSLVVSTRGRMRDQNKEYYGEKSPVLSKNIPLVVLVNRASASASEIVAGAIQDWDRGVVMGDTTFGKGSVQSVLPIDADHHLKLTTAFYYTPSGRCINKPENGIRGVKADEDTGDSAQQDLDDVKNEESAKNTGKDTSRAIKDTTVYKTKGGRIVYGGGGIIPDTIVDYEIPSSVVRALFLKDVFFKFANSKYPQLQKEKVVIDSTFTITKKLMDDFYAFLDSIKFEYKSYADIKFEEFRIFAGLAKDTTKDSTANKFIDKPAWDVKDRAELEKITKQLSDLIKKEEKNDIQNSEASIKEFIREALLVRSLGQDNSIVFRMKLNSDKQVNSALSIVSDRKVYNRLLQVKGK